MTFLFVVRVLATNLFWIVGAMFRPIAEFVNRLFKRKSKLGSASFSILALDPKKQEFLLDAKRPDWSDKDCESAKFEIHAALENPMTYDFSLLPLHYYYLLDDQKISEVSARLQFVLNKLSAETTRRAGK